MNDEEVDFADLGELGELGVDELDYGGKIGNGKETEESVDKKIKYIEENLWEKLERVGKKISFARDILALVNYMRDIAYTITIPVCSSIIAPVISTLY